MNPNLDQAIAAARGSLVRYEVAKDAGEATTFQAYNCTEHLAALLAALDAARGEAVGESCADHFPGETGYVAFAARVPHGTKLFAAPPAPPAAPRVERYGDGVLVHWPEGVEQYVCVGDCVTGNLGAMAVPADFTEWLAREMPAGTVIGDPQWWANLIARRFAQFAAKENTNG